jgi:hypothetical protein
MDGLQVPVVWLLEKTKTVPKFSWQLQTILALNQLKILRRQNRIFPAVLMRWKLFAKSKKFSYD